MSDVRQTKLRLLFSKNETDVTSDLCKDLLSWNYSDHESGQADEISLVLKDETGKWAGSWRPDGGEIIRMYISVGTPTESGPETFLGTFFVDYQTVRGYPRTYELRAVSIPLNKSIRREQKSRAWENKTLKDISSEIASSAGLELFWDSQENPQYDRIDQSRESDMKFLLRLCEETGLSIKVTDNQLVIFGQERYEKKEPVKTLTVGVSEILSYQFENSQSETYKSVTIKWRDPTKKKKASAAGYDFNLEKNKAKVSGADYGYDFNLEKVGSGKKSNPAVLTYTYTDPDADENGQTFEMKKRCTSLDEAKRLAKAKLRQLNSIRVTGEIVLVGDPMLVAGSVLAISGCGSFDGNFIIEEARHSGSMSGYTTSLQLRRVNTEY